MAEREREVRVSLSLSLSSVAICLSKKYTSFFLTKLKLLFMVLVLIPENSNLYFKN